MIKAFLALNIFVFSFFVSSIVAYDPAYTEVADPAVDIAMQGMRATHVHMTTFMFYTLNVETPGYSEYGVYNESSQGKIEAKGFYRWRQGPPVETNRELDFFLDSDSRGFFEVRIPGNTVAYTRDGRFQINSQRQLISLSGNFPVQGEGGDIYLPEGDEITVAVNGMIFMDGEPVDKLKVAVFKERDYLLSLNGAFYINNNPKAEMFVGDEYYKIHQYYLEQSNVLKAIIGDITLAKRGYEGMAKVSRSVLKLLSSSAGLAGPN